MQRGPARPASTARPAGSTRSRSRAADLRGKVVLVDFWTYTCINWLRTLAYVRAWAEKYARQRPGRGRRPHARVPVRARRRQRPPGRRRRWASSYPVALDSDYAVWQRLRQPLLAGVYIADARRADPPPPLRRGRLRRVRAGHPAAAARGRATTSTTSWSRSRPRASRRRPTGRTCESPETYLGYEQAQNFASPGGAALDEPHVRRARSLGSTSGRSSGDWTIGAGRGVLTEAGGRIAFRFHARDVHLVLGPRERGASVPFRVLVDGEPPGRRARPRRRRAGPRDGVRAAAVPAGPPAGTDRPTARSRSSSSTPGVEAYCSRSARR